MPISEPNTLRIIQISDCHLPADPQASYRGQNADANLKAVMAQARRWRPDLLLVTGDLSEDAGEASYRRLAGLLGTAAVPILALPGNHDEPQVMRRYFSQGPWDGLDTVDFGAWRLILVDSKKTGAVAGSIRDSTLEGLRRILKANPRQHKLVALHHQPLPVGAAWIDRFRLEAPEQLFSVLDEDQGVRSVVWGHIHHAFEAERNGVRLLGAPSSVANSLPATARFELDERGPACRWLELTGQGKVETGVLLGR